MYVYTYIYIHIVILTEKETTIEHMDMGQNHGAALFAHQRICGCLILPQQPVDQWLRQFAQDSLKVWAPIPSGMVSNIMFVPSNAKNI